MSVKEKALKIPFLPQLVSERAAEDDDAQSMLDEIYERRRDAGDGHILANLKTLYEGLSIVTSHQLRRASAFAYGVSFVPTPRRAASKKHLGLKVCQWEYIVVIFTICVFCAIFFVLFQYNHTSYQLLPVPHEIQPQPDWLPSVADYYNTPVEPVSASDNIRIFVLMASLACLGFVSGFAYWRGEFLPLAFIALFCIALFITMIPVTFIDGDFNGDISNKTFSLMMRYFFPVLFTLGLWGFFRNRRKAFNIK